MRLHYFWFLLFGVSTFSLFFPHTIIIIIIIIYINNNNNNHNNNNNNNNRNNIMPYIIIGFYLFLYTLTLNVIINTRFFKGSISPATLAVP